jgi:outer membrane receptor protein involved in Fe transport
LGSIRRIVSSLLAFPVLICATVDIRGTVLDEANLEPIIGANVVVKGTDQGAATDSKGYFEFSTSGAYPIVLTLTHIAYQTKELTVTADTTQEILMVPALLKGQDIEVIGERTQVGADVASSVEVVTAEKIIDIGARDVGDILRPLPSVTINATATGKQTVSIRGSNPNEVAIFLDGLRLNDSNTGLVDLSSIDLNDLERVEVVKGGATTLFGQGAFGGVISLTSKIPDSSQIAYNRGYGLTDEGDQDLSLAGTARLTQYALSGRYSGKSRRYDGNTLYTNIFNSFSLAAFPQFGEVLGKRYQLDNTMELSNGEVAQNDYSTLSTLTYSGSVFNSPDWSFFVGQREWGWTDHFFTNLRRELEEGNLTARISKQIINRTMSSTFQVDYEEQSYDGSHISYDSFTEMETRESNLLGRTNIGYTGVMRLLSEDIHPFVSKIRWELGLRGDHANTLHGYKVSYQRVIDSLTCTREVPADERDRTDDSMTRRLGVYMEGSTPYWYYTMFMNQGRNQRFPSLSDLYLWNNSLEEEHRAYPLDKEYLSTTDIGVQLIYKPPMYAPLQFEISLSSSIFVNQYTNKITYVFYSDRPPSPFNTPSTRISGYDLTLEGNLWNNRLNAQWAYQHINLDDPIIYPNKPESRLAYQVELRLPWVVVSYDFYRDGPQFILYNGIVAAQQIESRESANLNVIFRWAIRRLKMSLAYTVRNLFSEDPVVADPKVHSSGFPFQYYESHRRILTFRISL